MIRLLLLSLFVSLTQTGFSQKSYSYPILPQTGAKAEAFLPKGWHVLEKAEGDLNKDNISDLAVVMEADKEVHNLKEAENDQKPRILMAAFKQADGMYKLSVQSNKSVMLSNEGGVMGDPLAGLVIERGTLLVQFYGGSADRWGFDYRWRFQNNGWFLIGATYTTSSMNTNKANTYDFNLSTGAAEHTSGPFLEEDNGKTTPQKVRKFNIGNLRSFKPVVTEVYKDIFI